MQSADYLRRIGAEVRRAREALGITRRQLADKSTVSERFLAQLELGQGNISLTRFADVAAVLQTTPATLLQRVEQLAQPRPVALLGVRGAGKSTVGAAVAHKLGRRFVEVDREIEIAAGLRLGEIFELHGEAHYRKLEREVLTKLLADTGEPLVLATGGSIVSDDNNYALLRTRCQTVWLRATAAEHWKRVIAQGDARPMAKNPYAFEQLRALLADRIPRYQLADLVVDTGKKSIDRVAAAVLAGL
jgi:XRE family transcriptional regulator, aerobic/anaerobic benzoate catabolism transcriptional regulator